MAKTEPKINTPSVFEFYEFMAALGCRFIRLQAGGKLPSGKWQTAPSLTARQAATIAELERDNIGVVPGPRVVLADIDTAKALADFQAAMPGLTPTAKTPRGWHFWLVCPEGETIEGLGIEQGAGKTRLGEGVDTRTPGKGYGVGPGSELDKAAYQSEPPPGEPPWEYQLTGPIHHVTAAALACLRKPDPAAPRPRATARATATATPTPTAKPKRNGKGKPRGKRTPDNVRALRQPPELTIIEGQRNDAINTLAFVLATRYPRVSHEALRAEMDRARALCDAPGGEPYTDEEYEATLKSAFGKAQENSVAADPHIADEKIAGAFHDPSGNDVDDFHRQLAALNIEVCYNERGRRVEYRYGDGDWRNDGKDFDFLLTRLALLSPPRPELIPARDEGVEWDFPPARKVEKAQFDRWLSTAGGLNLRDHWLVELMALREARKGKGAADAALLHEFMLTWYAVPDGDEEDYAVPARWAPANTLVCAIKRAFFPGAKHDLTTLLISPEQGRMKSSLFQELLGPELYNSGVRLTGIKDPRQAYEQCAGVAVAEIADMRGLQGASNEEALPALTATHSPPVRPAYGRDGEAKARPYRHAWIVTTNKMNCISTLNKDNRRLLPVVLDEIRPDPNLASLPKALQDKLGKIDDPARRMVTALRDPEYKAALLHGALHLALDGAADPANGDFSGSPYEQAYPSLEATAKELTEMHRYIDPIHEGVVRDWREHESQADPDWLGGVPADVIKFMRQEQNMPGRENYEELLRNQGKLHAALALAMGRMYGAMVNKRLPGGGRRRIHVAKKAAD